MEDQLYNEFEQTWNATHGIDIPRDSGMAQRPRFKALHKLWQQQQQMGKSLRLASLHCAQTMYERGFKNFPKYEPLAENIYTALPSSINEFYGNVKVTPQINQLSQLHLIRPSTEFHYFTQINLRVGISGINICRKGVVDPISMTMLKASQLNQSSTRSFERGTFCTDRHGNANITHFMYDVLGRYIALRMNTSEDIGPLMLLKAKIGPYHRFLLEVFEIEAVFLEQGEVVHCQHLFVSTDILGDLADGFAHPMKLLEPSVFNYMRNTLLSVVKTDGLPKRILISRADAPWRRTINEDKVMRVLKRLGFSRVVLAKLSPLEQFSAFAGADAVIAPHGAGQSNMITMSKGALLKEFFHTNLGTDAFAIIAHRLNINYIANESIPLENSKALDFRIPLDELKTGLVS